jgi:hypothetical protein
MIKLMNNQYVYESTIYSHTGSNGGTEYTLLHNFGRLPDKVCCYVQVNDRWHELSDYYNTSTGNSYGWAVGINENSGNQLKVTVFNTYGGATTYNIKFVAYNLGTTQTITNNTPAFRWSSSEQVYPFEVANDGSTLYCKYYDLGAMPNSGWKTIAHNIPAWTADKIFSLKALTKSTNHGGIAVTVPLPLHDGGTVTNAQVGGNNINIYASNNYYSSNGYNAYMYLIYSK